MKALFSVYNKTNVVEFAHVVNKAGFSLVSTGGTHEFIQAAGIAVQQVSDLTNFPEILEGRVKTLSPIIHGGILARRNLPGDKEQLEKYDIAPIDIVVSNLYPFVETISRPDTSLNEALENIDIGGPAMIRAAAKNFPDVLIVVDPSDYEWISTRLKPSSSILDSFTLDERKELARKAFQHIALYDTAISQYLGNGYSFDRKEITFGYSKLYNLRYGENPHQKASLTTDPLSTGGIARAKQHHGRELSFNNILDGDSAFRIVSDYPEPAATIVKHTNPCGLAIHENQSTAYQKAFEGDPTSAYGGIVGFNRTVTESTAKAMKGVFYEIIIAPSYEPNALEILKKRRNLRILEVMPSKGFYENLEVRKITGGALIQTADVEEEDSRLWRTVTNRVPTPQEMLDLSFTWKAAKHVKSNGIVIGKDSTLMGIGVGQPNRVTSVHLAVRTAGVKAKGSSLASDAFFPFPDNIELASKSGITAIIQPGGSIRDQEVIDAANSNNIAMVFTGVRHFKH